MTAVAELVVEPYPFELELEELETAFSTWENTCGEGTRHLWLLLGRVHELASACEASATAKAELIAHVSADPSIAENLRWIAEKKSAHELLLVKLLGLKPETRSTKSQWHSALKAARKAGIEPSQSAFLEYIVSVGGVEKARQSTITSRAKPSTFEELAERVGLIELAEMPSFRAPTIFGDEVGFPQGYGLVLVRGEMAGGDVTPIATIVAPKVIGAAIQRLLAYDRASA